MLRGFGIRIRRILCGRRIRKIRCLRSKRVRKLISSGRRNINWLFQKLEKLRMTIRPQELRKIGRTGEKVDMDGRKTNRREVVVFEGET